MINQLMSNLKWFKPSFQNLFLVSFIFFSHVNANGQTTTEKRNPYVFTKNSFSIEVSTGLNKTTFRPVKGIYSPASKIGMIHTLNFDYNFPMGDHFSFSAGAGFGFFQFNAKTRLSMDQTESMDVDLQSNNTFGSLRTSIHYRKWLSQKWGIHGTLRFGAYKAYAKTIYYSVYTETDLIANVAYAYDRNFKPYLSGNIGVDRILKNDDVVSLNLGYMRMFKPMYSGEYYLFNNTNYGTLENKGNNLKIGLFYTFTRARKLLYAEDGVYSKDLEFKEAKRQFRIEKRFIDPKACFFGLSSGLFYSRSLMENSTYPMEDDHLPTWVIHANGEMGLKKNFFAQAGISLTKYTSGVLIHRPDFSVYYGSAPFISPSLSAGLGYRFIAKNNINFLNLSAGVSVLANFSSKELHTSFKSPLLNVNGEMLFSTQNVYQTIRHVVPTVYVNLSRDFQLSESLYLSLDYRFNLGFMSTYTQDIVFYESPDFDVPLSNKSSINGTSNAFQIGLKYKFVPKR